MYSNGYGVYNNQSIFGSTVDLLSKNVWSIVSLILALCAGIVLYFTFLNQKNAESYTGTTKKLYDFLDFKTITLEAVLKICYLVVAIFITISSFSFISVSFVAFLLFLFIGNVVARVAFESILLLLMIYRKLNEINNKLTPRKEEKKETKKIEVKVKKKETEE